MNCRHCQNELSDFFIDLGSSPPSNAYLTPEMLHQPEKWFPLRVLVCNNCWLVQTEDFSQANELFSSDYAYFSSTSKSWLRHAESYVAQMVKRFSLNKDNHVVEIAANDGYLLQYINVRGIPCTGIEPTASTAASARAKGIPIIEAFFGTSLAEKMVSDGKSADLIAANNVLAHVPDINDFVAGFARLLKPTGVATFEFPHLLKLVTLCQFDTIYHEHYSYLSLTSVMRIFSKNRLKVFDVEEISTHGGSLRVYAQRDDAPPNNIGRTSTKQVEELLKKETDVGINNMEFYKGFQPKAESIKNNFIAFLLDAKKQTKKVAAYGAAAKGNTLLNFAGVRPDLLSYVVDRSTSKQMKFLPGSHIPIVDESRLREDQPDYIIIFPWNIKAEIMHQLSYIRSWAGKFVIVVPALEIL